MKITYPNCSWYYNFNNNNEFILYGNWDICSEFNYQKYNIIWIYSTETKNNKWFCKNIYEIPEHFEVINISKYADKLYLFSNRSIYEWDLVTKKGIKVFYINDKEYKEFKVINTR